MRGSGVVTLATETLAMRRDILAACVLSAAISLSACKVNKHLQVVSANEADATLVLQYEHGFEQYVVEWDEAEKDALERCATWGYSAVEFSDSGTIECIEKQQRTVTGARPPGESEEPGMGTQAAERERKRRSLGTVGQSVRSTPPAGAEYGCVYWRVTYLGHCIE